MIPTTRRITTAGQPDTGSDQRGRRSREVPDYAILVSFTSYVVSWIGELNETCPATPLSFMCVPNSPPEFAPNVPPLSFETIGEEAIAGVLVGTYVDRAGAWSPALINRRCVRRRARIDRRRRGGERQRLGQPAVVGDRR